ncbi:GLPGLI family protein [Neolewinella aurantiaca]|uniref:GLPGLI family protein n=1 Tax=Neolewinella aurantiaca TaxID=2602767 RepID=A0A5C7FT52_9BACT|nr:GLPGLI family protein [Neolewinella aurantiaca]TXF88565.1 GLPGLI family protein [Neolewinella aurantiaca]
MQFQFRFLFALLFLGFTGVLSAQITSGTIDYNESFTFDFGDWMPKDRKEEMKKRMASGEFDRTGRLQFTADAFSYSQVVDENSSGGGRWGRFNENPDIFFTSIKDSTVTDRRQVMDQSFIMEDKWVAPKWNIANMKVGMKEIPLPTQLATSVSIEGDTLTAYFTPSIPLGIGPRGYGGLPGAIVYLKVQRDGRTTEYKMTTMQPNAELDMEKPADEKVITRKEFDKHMKRATEMMERRRRGWERSRG